MTCIMSIAISKATKRTLVTNYMGIHLVTKKKIRQLYKQVNAAMNNNSHGQESVMNKGKAKMPQGMSNFFTEEQYGQIMRLLNKEKAEEHKTNMAEIQVLRLSYYQ
uniref:Uncharacterized protein LOC104236882 n=1 Tax=Nicotiana sylvestris TaxID=4096 RepID=A0A1U7XHU4_NICSY|nr:PREDICTED: uncharacterized protein LOC104236882 [Nicotiana sylvestris]